MKHFRRYETTHERKYEWHARVSPSAQPLYPTSIGYSRWWPGAVQVRRAHPGFSVEIVLAGGLVHYCAGTRLRLRPGDVLLKHPGSAYRLRPAPDGACHKMHVALEGSALALLLGCWGLGSERAVRFADPAVPRAAANTVFAAAAAGLAPGDLGPACYQLLDVLARARPRRQRPAALGAALSHIGRHCTDQLRVADIAAHAGVTPSHLHRLFRNHLGCSPIDYALRLRLERAADLLEARGDLLVKQVAAACGFADQRYFSRLFRRQHAMTPQQWRRRK